MNSDDGVERLEEQEGLILKEVGKNKKRLPIWLDRPYHVWRDKFQEEKCCPKQMVKRELIHSSAYSIFLNGSLFLYILLGCSVFDLKFTSGDQDASFWDRALFCVTTISTIGYGNIVPYDDKGKWICILYCIGGIPLFFMTVASNSMMFIDLCNIIYMSFRTNTKHTTGIAWHTSATFLFLHCLLGSLMFSQWIDKLDFLDAFYFSFISITTIGYGDFSPSPETPLQYLAVVLYLCTGVGIVLMFFSSLQRVIQWIHYYGRKVSDSEELEFKVGGQMMTVKELVEIIAKSVGSTPEKLREVLHDLDKVLEVACKQAEGVEFDEESVTLVRAPEELTSPAPRKKTVLLSVSSVENGPDENQATVHSFSSFNQRTIPKDTELAIAALGTIQHHLRKPSVRVKSGSQCRTPPIIPVTAKPISKGGSDSTIETKCSPTLRQTSLELRKQAHRVHSDGRLLVERVD